MRGGPLDGRTGMLLAIVAGLSVAAMLLFVDSPAWRETTHGLTVLPAFATLKASAVNLRVGPGRQYPVEWIYHRKGWPVEIIAVYGNWRRVEDVDGTQGWVHRALLSPNRAAVVRGGVQRLREQPSDAAAVVARVEPRVVVRLEECRAGWCRIEAAAHEGWVRSGALWGAGVATVQRRARGCSGCPGPASLADSIAEHRPA